MPDGFMVMCDGGVSHIGVDEHDDGGVMLSAYNGNWGRAVPVYIEWDKVGELIEALIELRAGRPT